MKWSFSIARVAGIDVRIHLTFFLLLAWFGVDYYREGGWLGAWAGMAFICLLFLCVLLHEFGHAFAAKYFGINTPDITLLPIGGVARLERMPDSPFQELVVAVAGPAVNVFIAAGLYIYIGRFTDLKEIATLDQPGSSLLLKLMAVNIALVVFNLIPAFPMDGGRILRALLATQLSHAKATRIAARVGQGVAILFGILGIMGNPFLLLIAVFVFLGAQQEVVFSSLREAAQGLRVGQAMVTQFVTMPRNFSVQEAATQSLSAMQPIFPVVDSQFRCFGMVLRDDLLRESRGENQDQPVQLIARKVPLLTVDEAAENALEVMQQSGNTVLPVVNPSEQVVGLVSLQHLLELGRVARRS